MLVPGHVCSLYLATGGVNGSALGSDEKEIVMLHYTVIDVLMNEVSAALRSTFRSEDSEIAIIGRVIKRGRRSSHQIHTIYE